MSEETEAPEMETRNFFRNDVGGWDCEVNHPAYGWVPYTLEPEQYPAPEETAE